MAEFRIDRRAMINRLAWTIWLEWWRHALTGHLAAADPGELRKSCRIAFENALGIAEDIQAKKDRQREKP